MSVHLMSMSVDWATPTAVYDQLDAEFHFSFDPCWLGGGVFYRDFTKDGKWALAKDANGLEEHWGHSTFVNPPYGREIGKWTAKAVEEWRTGKLVVMLIPSRTDTIWWHRDIMQATEIRFIKGRLKFGSAANNAPFPSAVVVFAWDKYKDDISRWLEFGAAEPPSAPAPCPTNHTLKAPSMAGNTQVGFVYIPYKSRFCPDCGAFLGTPEGQKGGVPESEEA